MQGDREVKYLGVLENLDIKGFGGDTNCCRIDRNIRSVHRPGRVHAQQILRLR
jgi:hypothetical protein